MYIHTQNAVCIFNAFCQSGWVWNMCVHKYALTTNTQIFKSIETHTQTHTSIHTHTRNTCMSVGTNSEAPLSKGSCLCFFIISMFSSSSSEYSLLPRCARRPAAPCRRHSFAQVKPRLRAGKALKQPTIGAMPNPKGTTPGKFSSNIAVKTLKRWHISIIYPSRFSFLRSATSPCKSQTKRSSASGPDEQNSSKKISSPRGSSTRNL